MQRGLMNYLESVWKEPDEGLWEVRGGRQHFVHSKVLAWVAADRATRTLESWPELGGPVERYRALRDEIHRRRVRARASTPIAARSPSTTGHGRSTPPCCSSRRSASCRPSDERVRGTLRAVQRELSVDGFVRRYDTGRDRRRRAAATRASFLACSFWLADALVLDGQVDAGRAQFERLLDLRNDVGLLAEEYDVTAGRQLGNLPQAYSHLALVNSALNLANAAGTSHRRKPNP